MDYNEKEHSTPKPAIRIELSPKEHCALILLNTNEYGSVDFGPHETIEIEETLIAFDLAKRTEGGLQITLAGRLAVTTGVTIQYPLHSAGNVGSYDKVFAGISEPAANALLCSAMNHRVFDKVPKKTMRVFFQHLLDTLAYTKMGEELVGKWQVQMNKSMAFLKGTRKKYANTTNTNKN
jgi:hypothetical protein